MKLDRALQIASKARIRRYALPPRTEVATPASPSSERDRRGVSPGRPPRDALREAYHSDLYWTWRRFGRSALRELAEQAPGKFLRIMSDVFLAPERIARQRRLNVQRVQRCQRRKRAAKLSAE